MMIGVSAREGEDESIKSGGSAGENVIEAL